MQEEQFCKKKEEEKAEEDEEWSEGEAERKTKSPAGSEASEGAKGAASPRPSTASPVPGADPAGAAEPSESPPAPTPPPPRVRLNPSLATDPALRLKTEQEEPMEVDQAEAEEQPPPPAAATPKSGGPTPTPTPTPPPTHIPTSAELEYIASLPPVLQTVIASGRFFCPPELAPARPTTPRASKHDAPSPAENRQGPVFMCSPCGIRYSSLSTLEAHQTYYCSHRRTANKGAESESEDSKTQGESLANEDASGAESGTSEPARKTIRKGKAYRCPHCSYSADKNVSLNRHMRMHSTSPAAQYSGETQVDPVLTSSHLVDRYCQDCDIRFSSLKTFRAHKLHYCSTRHVIKGKPPSAPSSPSDRVTPESPSIPDKAAIPPQPILALPTNPILIVPYSLFQSASVLSGAAAIGLPTQDTACLLLPDGTLQPMAQGILSQSNPSFPKPHRAPQSTEPQQVPNKSRLESSKVKQEAETSSSTTPLDLSLRRDSAESDVVVDMSEDEKENRQSEDNTTDHEDIVCAPSIPLMLSTSSTCSSPSPVPLSPASSTSQRKRPKLNNSNSPSPHSQPISPANSIKSSSRTPNGVIGSKSNEPVKRKSSADSLDSASNLSSLLLAASNAQKKDPSIQPELPFPPELIPHLSSKLNLMKQSKAVPPLLRAPSELLSSAILPLLTPEVALQLSIPPMAPMAAAPPDVVGPQVLVKQGVSKCQECNIIFCKYETYLAHKKHYCSARINPESEGDSKSSPPTSPANKVTPPPPLKESPGTPIPPPPLASLPGSKTPLYQFICAACGIKFTSFDNLTAHQTFYCPKRPSVEAETIKKCHKCKANIIGPLEQHQCSATGVGGWRCLVCPHVSATSGAAQRHLDSHTNIRAFLCSICRYKGNTLRGMRTHIRMHFDKRTSDIVEENYISCQIESPNPSPSSKEGPESTSKPSPEDSSSCNGNATDIIKVKKTEEEEFIDVDDITIKSEPMDDNSNQNAEMNAASPEDTNSLPETLNNNKKFGSNYCKSCDISFNYVNSFLVHKKYYCSSHQANEATNGNNNAKPHARPTSTQVT
nr:PREDICTED: zinc finger protein ush [Bemisia tabaci]